MQWAARKRLQLGAGVFVSLAALATLGWYFFLYTPPSCFDAIQNQDEGGVDCGGVCALQCTAPRVDAVWTRPVQAAAGVYHVAAFVQNPLLEVGGTAIQYTMSLYDASGILVATRRGSFDLGPGESRPLFEPNIVTGARIPVRASTELEGGVWTRTVREQHPLNITSQSLDSTAARLTARIANSSAAPVSGALLIALVYDQSDSLIAASQTFLDSIPPRGEREAVFSWAVPFASTVGRADIHIVLPHAVRP